jgi:hypothetical protein
VRACMCVCAGTHDCFVIAMFLEKPHSVFERDAEICVCVCGGGILM